MVKEISRREFLGLNCLEKRFRTAQTRGIERNTVEGINREEGKGGVLLGRRDVLRWGFGVYVTYVLASLGLISPAVLVAGCGRERQPGPYVLKWPEIDGESSRMLVVPIGDGQVRISKMIGLYPYVDGSEGDREKVMEKRKQIIGALDDFDWVVLARSNDPALPMAVDMMLGSQIKEQWTKRLEKRLGAWEKMPWWLVCQMVEAALSVEQIQEDEWVLQELAQAYGRRLDQLMVTSKNGFWSEVDRAFVEALRGLGETMISVEDLMTQKPQVTVAGANLVIKVGEDSKVINLSNYEDLKRIVEGVRLSEDYDKKVRLFWLPKRGHKGEFVWGVRFGNKNDGYNWALLIRKEGLEVRELRIDKEWITDVTDRVKRAYKEKWSELSYWGLIPPIDLFRRLLALDGVCQEMIAKECLWQPKDPKAGKVFKMIGVQRVLGKSEDNYTWGVVVRRLKIREVELGQGWTDKVRGAVKVIRSMEGDFGWLEPGDMLPVREISQGPDGQRWAILGYAKGEDGRIMGYGVPFEEVLVGGAMMLSKSSVPELLIEGLKVVGPWLGFAVADKAAGGIVSGKVLSWLLKVIKK